MEFEIVRALCMNSGFGWDSVKGIPTASSEVHKKVARYRHKSLPYYDLLEKLYTGVGATGKFARSGLVSSTIEQEIQNTIAVNPLLILANSSSQESLASYHPDEYLDNSPVGSSEAMQFSEFSDAESHIQSMITTNTNQQRSHLRSACTSFNIAEDSQADDSPQP
ncbi:hypothetical protein HOY80DRAFT_1005089 [Tuber brumale]|nr:hypothetical protein HOY80DRAFT_1005089 [Tuber brumale]